MSEQSEQKSACCVWDFTLYEDLDAEDKVKAILTQFCKKWCFQLEKGEKSGLEHFQGRFSLKNKTRKSGVLNLFPWKKWHISPTSKANRDNMFYVSKEDSRISGPWSDEDVVVYIPRDIRDRSPRDWQIDMIQTLSTYHERWIDVLVDTNGNNGKSWLTRYMMCHGLGQLVPLVNDAKDLMRLVMDMPKSKCYIIDMPRTFNKDRLFQFWGAIEMIKGGYAYDDRYHFKQELFDPPRILIITNQFPDEGLMSKDRWRFWEIDSDGKLAASAHSRSLSQDYSGESPSWVASNGFHAF